MTLPLCVLSDLEFRTWCPTAVEQLAQLLLFRWDPDQVADEFPQSLDHYEGLAHSLILGLRMGDDLAVFKKRMRNQRRLDAPAGCDDESLDRLWFLAHQWLPRSLAHWWNGYAFQGHSSLPYSYNLIDDSETNRSHGDWVTINIAIAQRMASEASVTELRSAITLPPRPVPEALDQIRHYLSSADVGLDDPTAWISPQIDFALRICMDEDLHIDSAIPLPMTAAYAQELRFLRNHES